nr:hypothetical protein [Tanacetum cinerariifolium]
HRPILLREMCVDYGPYPFRFINYWFELEGFDSFVADTWRSNNILEFNTMLKLIKKLKLLKWCIRTWVHDKKEISQNLKKCLKNKLSDIDISLDKGQKAIIKWAIEGDENSKFFHGIINKHRKNLVVRGIIADEEWIKESNAVKNEFFSNFRDRFDRPCKSRLTLDMEFPNKLSTDQSHYLERPFSMEEVKGAVWGCGLNKSPGPDGFTFEFYRRYGSLIEDDVLEASKKKQTMIFKVNFEKAFDSVRWDFLDDVMANFGFDDVVFVGQWCDSNLFTIIRVLDYFFRASGLRINLHKSKLIGIDVEQSMVEAKSSNIGSSKEKSGLGVSRFYALNRALTFKWIWRFRT